MRNLRYKNKNADWCDATYTIVKTTFRDCFNENGNSNGDKFQAIINFRNKTNTGLKEAKEFVDIICNIQYLKQWHKYLPSIHLISGMDCSNKNNDEDEYEIEVEEELEPYIEQQEEFIYG